MAADKNLCVVADRVLGLLRSEDVREIGLRWGVAEELRGLEKTVSVFAPLLLDAEKKTTCNYKITEWLRRLEEVLDDADNLLEELATEASLLHIHRSSSSMTGKMSGQVRSLIFSTLGASQVNSMRQKIEDIKMKLEHEIEVGEREMGLEERCSDKEVEFLGEVVWQKVVDKMEIIIILLDMNFEENVTVLPILGSDQLELTKLGKDIVYNEKMIKENFCKRIWIRHPRRFDEIINEVFARVCPDCPIHSDKDKLLFELSSSLSRKRFLIVLDDAWVENPVDWHFLKDLKTMGVKGSKIIVTTRDEGISRVTGTIPPYFLDAPRRSSFLNSIRYGCPIREDRLRSLFENVAFGVQKPTDSMKDFGNKIFKEIVKSYAGLPLVIMAIGSMLYFENSEKGWRSFYEDELSKIVKHSNFYYSVIESLRPCYEHLPSPLKHCFAYCSLFPKDHEIDVQTLIKMWMAQGFIVEQPEKSPEDVGYDYVLNLLRRSFFQEPRMDARGRVIKFKLHYLMHRLSTNIAWKHCAVLSSESTDRRLTDERSHVSYGSSLFSADVLRTSLNRKKTRSFLFQSQLWRKKRGIQDNYKICEAVISRCKFLRALDMHAIGIKIVPYSIGELKFLKYLDLSENEDIIELPDSITRLLNLQTLRLSSCFRLRQLPRDIGNLINLRHLEIDGCYSLTSLPRGFGRLTNLQTLSQIILSENSSMHNAELHELKGLSNLREEFQIKNLRHEKDDIALCLSAIQKVQSLSLEWDNHVPESNCKQMLLDSDVSSDLKELAINGYMGVSLFSPSFSLPSNLVKLSLRRCLKCEELPSLHQLRHLKVLILDEINELKSISSEAPLPHNSSSTAFFPSLRELWLTELPKLETWMVYGGYELPSFPCLSKLVIEDCPKLEYMPLYPTLEEGLVLDTTYWFPFERTMEQKTQVHKAKSSTSSSSSAPLSKLKNLCLVGIEQLSHHDVDSITWGTLESLRFLRLDCLPRLDTFPQGFSQITNLQELHIWRCCMGKIDGIEAFEFLEKLVIRVCPNLKLLPEGIRRLRNLVVLEIEDCPTLLRRCEKETGADWDKIAHIPEKRLAPISGR